MSWRTTVYGTEDLSKTSVIVTNFILAFTFLGAYGWWADFAPSSEWSEMGFKLASTATVTFIFVYYLALLTGRAKFKPNTSISIKILAVALLPAIVFFFFLLAITHGLGDIATQIIGQDNKLTTAFTKNQTRSRRLCDYRLEGHAIENALPDYVCISEKEFQAFPQAGMYTLQTKQTGLGIHIKSLTPVVNR
ncbi:hypothetical protein SAMN05216271_0800 [Halopseudomonas sabulinigri]|uniref:Uncharacterized protein n=1 Tax=Halopseudomonas sabulinigri TaxID=472181 RepID=A0A1H1N765_9GAMM|nr:hypothetical protein [Halopseudomonas sabulinigri]SDR94757.1 hypothetical protein SAMN05216271_0800 [Halopseudomonas sabulinigri]